MTLFSIPKPFRGDAAVLQRNALRSWLALAPRCEVLLLGDDEGVAEAAAEFGVRHIPDIARNERGTPLLDDAFARADRAAREPLLCYVNADIILLGDLIPAVRRIPFRKFLMAGRRWDLDLGRPWDFDRPDWEDALRREVRERARPHPPMGSDYFVFPRDAMGTLPPFAVGRPGWDNWFLYRARELRIPLIDASAVVTAVHQDHGYAHVRDGSGTLSEGAEGDRNIELIGGCGGWDRVYVLADATHVLTPARLEWATTDEHLRWRIERRPERRPRDRVRNRILGWIFARRRFMPDFLWRRLAYALS